VGARGGEPRAAGRADARSPSRSLWDHLALAPSAERAAGGGTRRAYFDAPAGEPASPARTVVAHGVRGEIHTDAAAGALARSLDADAVTVGARSFFAPGAFRPGTPDGDRLIRHELAHVAQAAPGSGGGALGRVAGQSSAAELEADRWEAGDVAPVRERAPAGIAYRRPVAQTTAQRHAEADVVGAAPGMTLAAFDDWSTAQLDWFAGISEASRGHLWRMRDLLNEGDHILTGLGAMKIHDLIAVPAGDVDKLRWYAAGSADTGQTVHITAPTAVVARALDLGAKLHLLETQIGSGIPLRAAMPQTDFEAIADSPVMWPRMGTYLTTFHPQFQVPAEMAGLRRLLTGADPLTFTNLVGRIRNLHRFPIPLLIGQLLVWATRGMRALPPVTLVLQSVEDWLFSFHPADEVLLPNMAADPRFRLLIIEGPASLAAAQAQVLDIAANFGPIRDTIIIGHGESRETGLANNPVPGAPRLAKPDAATYPEERLDLTNANAVGGTPTTRFFDALLRSMDPAQARIVFVGCLVGTNQVPETITDANTGALRPPTPAEITAFYADPQRLALRDWLEQRPASQGMAGFSPGFVSGARAETGIGGMSALTDPGTGRAQVVYPSDAPAFGSADDYIRRGADPIGLARAARELMVSSPPAAIAATSYRVLHPLPSAANPWWAEISNQLAMMLLPAMIARDLARVHALEAIGHHAFMSFFSPAEQTDELAKLAPADAAVLFAAMLAALPPGNPSTPACRLIVRRAEAAIFPARLPAFRGELDATTLTDSTAAPLLAPHAAPRAVLAPMLPVLLPVPVVGAPSRGQLLLAFALASGAPARATPPGPADLQELQFLHGVAAATRSFPAPVTATLLAGFASEESMLRAVGLGPAPIGVVPPGSDPANARFGTASATNVYYVHGRQYVATIASPVANVRSEPNLGSDIVRGLRAGDTVRVIGMVGDWAAVDVTVTYRPGHPGRLGFIHKSLLAPPPTP
jgi:hypothetical protein